MKAILCQTPMENVCELHILVNKPRFLKESRKMRLPQCSRLVMEFQLAPRAATKVCNKVPMQRPLAGTIVNLCPSHPREICTFLHFAVHDLLIESVRHSISVIIHISHIHFLDILLGLPHSKPQDFGWTFLLRHQPREKWIHVTERTRIELSLFPHWLWTVDAISCGKHSESHLRLSHDFFGCLGKLTNSRIWQWQLTALEKKGSYQAISPFYVLIGLELCYVLPNFPSFPSARLI